MGHDAKNDLEMMNLNLLRNSVDLTLRYKDKIEELRGSLAGETIKDLAMVVTYSVYGMFDAVVNFDSRASLLMALPDAVNSVNSALWNALMIGYDCSQKEQMARFKVGDQGDGQDD